MCKRILHVFIYPAGGIAELAEVPSLTAVEKRKTNQKVTKYNYKNYFDR